MKSVYIQDLEKNLLIDQEPFLVASSDRAQDRNGNDFYKVVLQDKTGRIDAKIWSETANRIDRKLLKEGKVIAISGKVDEYKGTKQITISDVRQVDESILDEFLESSEYDADKMFEELVAEINTIEDKSLREIMLKIVNDKAVGSKLKYWPAGNSIHHGFRSGMLQHVLEMLQVGKSMKRFYPDANYDVLTAGIILHDIGKIEELGTSPVGQSSYSKKGSLVGHIVLGAMMFAQFAEGKVDEDTYLHVIHLILSHHGTREFGSPVLPATVEAFMLHHIDNISSKAKAAQTALRNLPEGEEFSDFNKWLGGIKLWNGGVVTKNAKSENVSSNAGVSDDAIDDEEISSIGDQITLV